MKGRKGIVILTLFVGALSVGVVSCKQMDSVIGAEAEARRKEALDRSAQRRTVADIRNVGTAMFSWLTDQVGAAAAGQPQNEMAGKKTTIGEYTPIPRAELVKLLVPKYLQAVPEKDGWGHPYEYYLLQGDTMAKRVMSIRSPGRDGKFDADEYQLGPFDPDRFDEDVVWADGYFVCWPQRPPSPSQ
jgi:hypothetical protein